MNYIEYNKDPVKNSYNLGNQQIQYFNTKNEIDKKINDKAYTRGLEIQARENALLKDNEPSDFDTELAIMKSDMSNDGVVQLKHCSMAFWGAFVKAYKSLFDWQTAMAKVVPAMLEGLVKMMVTPEGIKVFSEIIGFDIGVKLTVTLIYQGINKVLINTGVKAAESAAEMVAQKVICTAAKNLMTGAVMVIRGAEAAAEMSEEIIVAAACPPCGVVMTALFWVQIIGLLLDLIDPFHCADGAATVEALDADALNNTINGYNTVFKDNILSSGVGSTKLSNGDVIVNESIWPIQFPGLNLFDRDLILPHQDTLLAIGLCTQEQIDNEECTRNWDDVYLYYQCQYLQTLKINSAGLPCNIPLTFDSSDILEFKNVNLKYKGKLAMTIANKNPDIADWIYKWWPIIVLIFIIIILCIIKLII